MVARPHEAAPDKGLSWRKAFLLNERNLVLIAAWAHTEQDIQEIFMHAVRYLAKRNGVARRYQRYMNREDTRAVLHVLAREALKTDGNVNPGMSLNALAAIIDRSRREVMVKTLKSIILPALGDAAMSAGSRGDRKPPPWRMRYELRRRGSKRTSGILPDVPSIAPRWMRNSGVFGE